MRPIWYFFETIKGAHEIRAQRLTLNRPTYPKPPRPQPRPQAAQLSQTPKKFSTCLAFPKWYIMDQKDNAMTQNLPAETVRIAPEALEVANCYLQLNDPRQVATELDLDVETVTEYLKRREVKAYIDSVFFDSGYNNRFLMRRAMDALIKQKFQELEEAGAGSQKDISELLALSHKMSMDLMDKEIQLEKIRSGNAPQKQVNVQINEGLDGSKYSQLVQRLITGEGI